MAAVCSCSLFPVEFFFVDISAFLFFGYQLCKTNKKCKDYNCLPWFGYTFFQKRCLKLLFENIQFHAADLPHSHSIYQANTWNNR